MKIFRENLLFAIELHSWINCQTMSTKELLNWIQVCSSEESYDFRIEV